MVLDPLSIFSVACNVMQVIEIGVKVLSKTAEFRKTGDGVLTEHQDLRSILLLLGSLNNDLQSAVSRRSAAASQTAAESNLIDANNECLRLSTAFVELLDSLKVRDRHILLDGLRMSIKILWKKDTMDAMMKSISQARDNLNLAYLVYMNSKQATRAAQDEILRSTTQMEGNIMRVVESSLSSLQRDIQLLSEQLERVSLDTAQQTVAQFTIAHHDLLQQMSSRLDSTLLTYTSTVLLSNEAQTTMAWQNIMDSLHFPRIRERESQIQQAQNQTYKWILSEQPQGSLRWANFVAWLQDSNSQPRIYWVHGKIGAGKTTLLRYLCQNLTVHQHMERWAGNQPVLRANCFFWNAGNSLQKSTVGLLRTLLTRLFQQCSDIVPQVVPIGKWQTGPVSGNHTIEWTEPELRDCLREFVLLATRSHKIFLMVDGMDEFEGTDDAREDLIGLLISLASNENLKICVSSRPWNIFKDAFGDYPQLRLEDLTRNDISTYIREQLHASRRFVKLQQHEPRLAVTLMSDLIDKAAGVFLWVRLVVGQLLSGLRDGDGIRKLQQKVEDVPSDLDDYFMRLMESIEPQDRREASEILQIALHEETEFTTLHSRCLIEFSFIEEGRPDFALNSRYDFRKFDMTDEEAMAFRIESTLRKLNSRCMGLLECNLDFDISNQEEQIQDVYGNTRTATTDNSDLIHSPNAWPRHLIQFYNDEEFHVEPRLDQILRAAWQPVMFLHRSLYDFLLTPKVQSLLHQYTNGPYDSIMFVRCARLVEIMSLHRSWFDFAEMVGLTSYVISTLTVSSFRNTAAALSIATMLQPVIEDLGAQYAHYTKSQYWYISDSLDLWVHEKSNFLSFAIDLGLTAYLEAHLTRENILSKEGRPLLDYALRPKFASEVGRMSVGNQVPNPELISTILGCGVDPNQPYQQSSIWARFLCFTVDNAASASGSRRKQAKPLYVEAMKLMLHHRADIFVRQTWLTEIAGEVEEWNHVVTDASMQCHLKIHLVSQATAIPVAMYAVSDIFEFLIKKYRFDLEMTKSSVLVQERQILQKITPI